MRTTAIQYCFILSNGCEEVFDLLPDLDKIELVGDIPFTKCYPSQINQVFNQV
ncbi:MAG: hypothetical protein ACUZ8H_06480 [Candidatus Anammoxibacter sp.]